MTTTEETPTLASEAANDVTTLALAPESESLSTTIVLEKKKAALDFWCARRDLHESGCKAFKKLQEKTELLRAEYERELDAWRGRKLMEPQMRLEAKKRRAATIAKKKADAIDRVVAAVGGIVAVKDKTKLAEVVAAALAPAEEAKKRSKKTARVEEEGDDSD